MTLGEERFDVRGRQYLLISLDRPLVMSADPFQQPFVCMLWDSEARATAEERQVLAAQIVRSSCRYAVCGGRDCEAWHDAIDAAFTAQGSSEAEEDERFLMTTWHSGESLQEVVWFSVQNTDPYEIPLEHRVFIELGGDQDVFRRLSRAVRREAAAWRPD